MYERKLTRIERIVRWAIRKLQRVEQRLGDREWAKVEEEEGFRR